VQWRLPSVMWIGARSLGNIWNKPNLPGITICPLENEVEDSLESINASPVPEAETIPSKPLFSPGQVYTGSMLGGPLAAAYFIKKNFDALGNEQGSKRAVILGISFAVLLILILPFLPSKTPNMVIPIAYSFAAYQVVKQYQRTKEQIAESAEYVFHSAWRVAGIGLFSMVIFLVPAIGVAYLALPKEPNSDMPHHAIVYSQIPEVVSNLQKRKKEKAFIALAISPRGSRDENDVVNIEYRIVDGSPTFLWMLMAKRNIADKEAIKRFASDNGVNLFEIQNEGVKILFSQDSKILELGEKIIRDYYKVEATAPIEMYEGQG